MKKNKNCKFLYLPVVLYLGTTMPRAPIALYVRKNRIYNKKKVKKKKNKKEKKINVYM